MGQWVELELRQEQFDFIIDCLESKCRESKDYSEIERCVFIIENLQNQEREYYQKLSKQMDF